MTGAGDVAIAARNLGVRYDLRLARKRTLRRAFGEMIHRSQAAYQRAFWAISDVSVSVCRGDVLGVIGRNGSGKSTLLLVLAGILRPDRGRVQIEGHSALLSVGAGFEPELTGHENVYLNGALLGFDPRRIDALMPEIEEFAGLGDFIHAPMRTYSSGMRTRLGFAVAAHIDPDILLLDEIMGVGDEEFRKRSETKLRELLGRASAIVLVSHDLTYIKEHCTNVLWLNQGTVMRQGDPESVVDEYRSFTGSLQSGEVLRAI